MEGTNTVWGRDGGWGGGVGGGGMTTFKLFNMLGKMKISAHDISIYFFIFPRKKGFHFMQTVSYRDNLHELSNPTCWENKKKNISKGLLKFSPSMLSINYTARWDTVFYYTSTSDY